MNSRQLKTIPVPQKLFETMLEAYQKWEKFSDEFEDYLLASDKKFIEKMRKARKEHLNGEIRDLQILKQELR
ncbi:MAG: hypothetical protein UV22_C0014G0009 [Parcubacteria group bacterium GW2011_GWA2_42_35]|nr:MAG: hypothetical protein UU96_C0003G0025 [Parcubacteria group bacterium GW2011_GWC2_42_13]KKS57738.1 MAG: hypothetical protein UV22_C0014G0009 [Parcubacteria group bacterium GW2011_GWA2_42_35]